MSKAPKASKQTSRWGSLLQQAVAGVESRLDTILADGDEPPAPLAKANGKIQGHLEPEESSLLTAPAGAGSSSKLAAMYPSYDSSQLKQCPGLSRSSSNNKHNDRLQARLAKAIVQNGSTRRSHSPASTSEFSSQDADSPRTSADNKTDDVGTGPTRQVRGVSAAAAGPGGESGAETDEKWHQGLYSAHTTTLPVSTSTSELMLSSPPSTEPRPAGSFLQPSATTPQVVVLNDIDTSVIEVVERSNNTQRSAQEYEAMLTQMQSDYEVSEIRRQEETHSFMERIDALQSKLQYLTNEALGTARTALTTAHAGSLDRRLAEKDEQIALLMEEGEKLSKTELRYMNTIKSLRSSILEDQKHSTRVGVKLEKAQQEVQYAKERARRAEEVEQRELVRSKTLSKVEKENESLKAELESHRAIAADLKLQMAQAPREASAAGNAAQADALEAERSVSAQLRDDLSKARIEKEISEEKSRSEIRHITMEAERAKEHAQATETELRREQSMLENRLEVLHTRAEEVTTGAVSDMQTKLLRQVEVLQTQHSIAIENWQGVEGSLLHRIKSLEEEKDEMAKKEGDLRRKARDLKIKLTRASEELDIALGKLNDRDQEFAKQSKEIGTIQESLRLSEAALAKAKAELTEDRASWEVTLAARIEDERNKWYSENNQLSSTPSQFRTRSPGSYARRGSSADLLGLHNGRPHAQTNSTNGSISVTDRSLSRHNLNQPLRTPDVGIPYRQDSHSFTPQQSTSSTAPPTPSVQISDHDDLFEGSGTPASPHRTINDMISVSTTGAGPSVQLVERMSATVRRLESEKAALKDELARLSYQRDEAREQVVLLMREVEEKRAADIKIQRLEEEISQVNERYHTTLEMLGEKSELVEELKADVADVKKIYRELVDSTLR